MSTTQRFAGHRASPAGTAPGGQRRAAWPSTACSTPRSRSSTAVRRVVTVVTERELPDDEVAAALDEAGDYRLVRA